MSVLVGPRREIRRILFQGRPEWIEYQEGAKELILADGRVLPEDEAIYLPPCEPSKIICIHLNYESRRLEFGAPELTTPTYFQKPLSCLNSHKGFLHRPADCQYLNYEGEIAVVIGRAMKNVGPQDVWDYIAGFAPANDVGAQDFRDTDAGSMLRVKGMDGFCPIGPGLVSGVDIRESRLKTYIDGQVVQDGAVSEMNFDIPYILADLCRHITFLPGDVVLTGTPANSRPMAIGNRVEVEVTGIGRLSNQVAEIAAPSNTIGHQPTDSEAVRRVALGDFQKPIKM